MERDERSHVSERMAMEYFWQASKYCRDGRRAARLLTFHCNILKLAMEFILYLWMDCVII